MTSGANRIARITVFASGGFLNGFRIKRNIALMVVRVKRALFRIRIIASGTGVGYLARCYAGCAGGFCDLINHGRAQESLPVQR